MAFPSWSPAPPEAPPSDDALAVVFWSALNSLGENARAAATAFRAGATGLRECPLVDSAEEAITLCSVPTLDPFLEGAARLDALAQATLADLLDRSATTLSTTRVKLFLLLDEGAAAPTSTGRSIAEELTLRARDFVQNRLGSRVGIEIDATGAAGIGSILERVEKELAAVEYECALVLGVHSDYSIARVAELDAAERIHSAENLDALLLGEGAAALVLVTPVRARSLGLTPTLTVGRSATTQDRARIDNDESAFEAAGLTVAVRRVVEPISARGERIGWMSSDANFEMFRNYELQATIVRTQSRLGPPQLLDTPCHRLGTLGAATGPWQVAYAAELFLRGDPPAPRCLCLQGSEDGTRSAFVISGA